MWPNYFYIEARRLAAERTIEAELAEMIREAALYREAHRVVQPGALRRFAAQLALLTGRAALRLARALDECAGSDTGSSPSNATPLG